jgi:hypothetical protein
LSPLFPLTVPAASIRSRRSAASRCSRCGLFAATGGLSRHQQSTQREIGAATACSRESPHLS